MFCTSLLGREITRIDRCFGLELAGSDLAAEPGQQIPQPAVEQVLREAVAGSSCARLVSFATGDTRQRFGAALVLVRPDQHVAWRGDDIADPESLVRLCVGYRSESSR